jgi:probable rRNA maturation factor
MAFRSADSNYNYRAKPFSRHLSNPFSKRETPLASITYVFCSDDYLLQMNRDFLNHDYYTDIITSGYPEKGQPVEAEVYISLDRVRENAKTTEQPAIKEEPFG